MASLVNQALRYKSTVSQIGPRTLLAIQPANNKSNLRFTSSQTAERNDNMKQDGADSKQAGSWLNNIFAPTRIHTGNRPHSRLLSASEFIYEMHHHDAKPESADNYIGNYQKYAEELAAKSNGKAVLVGSFRVEVGSHHDEFIHIWRYHDGYKQVSDTHKQIRTDSQLVKLNKDLAKDLVRRESQFMMSFSFWDHPKPQQLDSFYEMRSYVLKPGTMIDWANGWSKGIKHRDNAVAGFFSQIGQLYTVHHIWRYGDLQARKDIREDAWRRPGWDECVAITVPNIVSLHSRWMSPNSFSPIR